MVSKKPKKFRKVPLEVPVDSLDPLKIGCGSTKCEEGLHCFRMTERQIKKAGKSGICKECGASLVDWQRVHKRDSLDANYIFKSLKNELIRHVYWHMPIKDEDIKKALLSTPEELRERIVKRMTKDIGVAKPYRNGYTPYYGDVVFYGQHATATCCRRCMEYWYDIPMGVPLTQDQILFASDLITLYIKERLPQLFK